MADMRATDLAKLLLPPIVLSAARRIFPRPTVRPPWVSAFEGPFLAWEDAVAASDGWEANAILEKTLDASLQVQRGEAAYQQDAVPLDRILYSETILAFLAMAAGFGEGRVNVVDIGGSLGVNFVQNERVLRPFLDRGACVWRVVEKPKTAALGRAHFRLPGLSFHDAWSEAAPEHGRRWGALFSGSLQYIDDPWRLIDDISAAGIELIAMDRVTVGAGSEDVIYVQRPDPGRYYDASFPVRVFGRGALEERMRRAGFELVERFGGSRLAEFELCGMIFTRAH
jgi:putative methyltransferase (TIGR04325 family)